MIDKAAVSARKKAYRAANYEKVRSQERATKERNKEKVNALREANKKLWDATYYQKNKEAINAKNSDYKNNNKDKCRSYKAKYRSKKLSTTPNWLNKGHETEIEGFYQFCQIFNQYIHTADNKFEVDHIIPLQGKQVSGLHTPENLQVITRRENAVKRNTFNPDVYPRQGELPR